MTDSSDPRAPVILPSLLSLSVESHPTPAFLPALLGAGVLHLLALLLAPAAPPKPPVIPETALDVLILHERGQATDQPALDAALARRHRAGESPHGDAATSKGSDLAPPRPDEVPETALSQADAAHPEDTREPQEPELPPQPQAASTHAPARQEPAAPAASVVSQNTPAALVAQTKPDADAQPLPAPRVSDPLAQRPSPPDAARILASQGPEIARLTASLDVRSNAAAGRARRKSISASTREFRYASYLSAWARKVERIGNLNYPQAAKEQQLYGSLILHVAVRSDGSVERIRVVRSSGLDLLDQAAIQIVELAAPYAPFPADIAADTDVLDIVRTWQFMQGGVLGWER